MSCSQASVTVSTRRCVPECTSSGSEPRARLNGWLARIWGAGARQGKQGTMGHAFSTLVFDLDGTLTDPSLGITRCLNFALEEHGYPAVPDERLVAEIGPPLDETLLKFVSDPASAPLASLVAAYRERYSSTGYAENTVY